MAVSKAADYSILVVVYLSSLPADEIKSKSEIAKNLNLPADFLSKILQKLTKANIIQSVKGSLGGYRLIKAPHEITLRSIMEIMDGPAHMIDCLSDDFVDCGRMDLCQPIIRKIRSVEEEINSILDRVTFDKLMVNVNSENQPN